MKNLKLYTAAIGLFGLAACSKVLDKTNLSNLQPDLVFKDSTLVQLNMDNLYDNNLPLWGGQNTGSSLSGVQPQLSEESSGSSKFMDGTMSYGTDEPKDYGTSLNTNNTQPSNNWGKIRQVNTFIKSIQESPLPDYTRRKFLAQALFFRAFRYWDIVRIYGGVPLVLTPLDGVGNDARDAALLPRNKTSECFAQMVKDLDYAIANLPGKWTGSDWGKITSGAAAAFKGRVLLYWASPMFNPSDIASRWQDAYNANLQAKTILDANGFGLNSNYKTMWFSEVNNPEAVMVTSYNTATGDQAKKNNGWDKSCRPSYLNGSGSNQPTWELVRSYPMKDGKMPGDATSAYPYYDSLYYKNRDPRFDATIAYNGCTWPLDGNANLRLWTYYETSTKSTESSASNTGFYCRKAVSEGTFTFGDPQYSGTDWMEIRYAEVLLNLAESAVGISKIATTEEGYQGIIKVRQRAGITAGSNGLYGLNSGLSRAQLFDAILFERKIEFAFEGKRFWDLYRWKRMSDLNGWYRNRLRIVLKTGTGIPTAAALKDPTSASFRDVQNLDNMMTNYFQTIRNNNHDASNSTTKLDTNPINFLSTYYFFPIPLAAITNDPNLQQNNNWGGSFDPLQ
ncbi:RagB/SusD family nutrient uptake outer membrane protein [Flavisolibacter ginsenosidimutans]|uniref:RagB/SusD family nutrient uptake outer membrane protein n=1 Tax=Flavisolibacter ginsenosidimutans TaxID=661481 RepID=A0A5B8UGQ3_9BACT|nr:RagB/SusD family nutrient uptake outer membrane protein [Flavisolibacter ginsenosidimutans]QEC55683.1 RagB/SusD family nutrient uptake outer membrane protein [Flavisolibacter ginsenosidimutans]